MTLTLDRTVPWELHDLDPDDTLADLERRFPGISIWRGEYTGHFFAAVLASSRQDQLVEATTSEAFSRLLAAALRPRPAVTRPAPSAPARPAPAPDPCPAQTAPAPYQGRHQRPSLWRRFVSLWMAS